MLPGIQVKLNELVTEESRQKNQNVYAYVLFLLTKGSPIEYLTTDGTKVIHPKDLAFWQSLTRCGQVRRRAVWVTY